MRFTWHSVRVVLVALLIAGLTGCGDAAKKPSQSPAGSNQAASKTAPESASGSTQTPTNPPPTEANPAGSTAAPQVVDRAAYDKLIASHKGKVVLVDFWATWCGPCKNAFPHTVAIAKKYAPQGVVVISVCLEAADAEPEMKAFLKSVAADGLVNLRAGYENPDDGFTAFELKPPAIPQYKLYHRSGKLLDKPFVGGNQGEAIEVAIRELLAAAE